LGAASGAIGTGAVGAALASGSSATPGSGVSLNDPNATGLPAASSGAAPAAAASSGLFGGLKDLAGIGSSLYGIYQGIQQQNQASDALKASDPFGPYRAAYAEQLKALMDNPSSIMEDPGYKFQRDQGEQALVRNMAAGGYLGSGNLGVALTKYGEDYASNAYNARLSQLSTLAGAGISPNAGPALAANNMGIETMASSLASLGYTLGHTDYAWMRDMFGTKG
jgi:hypothetical protein